MSHSPPPVAGRRLLVSIHDVAPPFAGAAERLLALLEPRLDGPRLAMLVVPHHWAGASIAEDRDFARRLRGWADRGIEMFQHGWTHRDETEHPRRLDRWRARHMTAREGEFLGLDEAEARRRLRDGKAMIEDATGRAVAGFVAPAWLYGAGAHAALRGLGHYRLAEDHLRVWDPLDGSVLARGPVITWASRSAPRRASSLAVATAARAALGALPVVRVAVHPGDADVPRLIASIDATVAAFARRRSVARYADLLSREAAAA